MLIINSTYECAKSWYINKNSQKTQKIIRATSYLIKKKNTQISHRRIIIILSLNVGFSQYQSMVRSRNCFLDIP